MKNELRATILTIFLLIIFILPLPFQHLSLAAEDSPVTIVIGNGSSKVGPIFKSNGVDGQELWYPGYSASNILRIKNSLGEKIKINKIGMNITLEKNEEAISLDHKDAKSYLENMKIKVSYKNFLESTFKGSIFDGNFEAFSKGVDCSIAIEKSKAIDLKYTITMDKNAGNEVQGIKALADFVIHIDGDLIDPVDPEIPTNPKEPDKPKTDEQGTETVFNPSDIEGHWAHNCIKTLLKHGIIQGYPDGTIRPDNYITRAETAVLVGKALKLEEEKGSTGYMDLIPVWAKGYIKSTTTNNIFTGYPNKTFKPNKNITREEMSAVLMRAFNKTLEEDIDLSFTDKNSIGSWALEHVKAGVEHKIIEGYPDKTFKPKNNITRAEAFTMICKLLGYHKEHKNNR